MFAYVSGSPFVYMELYGISEKYYGYFFGTNALGLITFSQLNRRFSKSYSFTTILKTCIMIEFCLGIFLSLVAWKQLPLPFMACGLFFFVALMSLIFPNSTAGALSQQSKRAGSASALLGTLQFFIASLASLLVGAIHDGTAKPMTFSMMLSALGSLLIFQNYKNKRPIT
jgi:DHA1 family bicyclomycin/chloramphenicol resistance-like MFS transporter